MDKFRCFCIRRSLRWKIIISSISIIMCVLIFMPAASSIDSEYKFTASIKSNELDDDDIKIIHIKASDHKEYGQKAVKESFAIFKWLKFLSNFGYNDFKDYCEDNIEAWKGNSNFYDFIDEFKGIRAALKLNKLERVLYMGILSTGIIPKKDSCTTTAATNYATSSGDATFIHQNIDSASQEDIVWEILSKKIRVARIDGEYNYAFWSFPVLGEWPFLNEKDVGFVGNALRLGSGDVDTTENLTAMPSFWLLRRSMMDCDHVADPESQQEPGDVQDLWHDSERASGRDETWPHGWDNQNMIWCDGTGEILGIEQTHDYFFSKTGNPKDTGEAKPYILAHANHHQWLDHKKTGSIDPDDDNKNPLTGVRLDRAYELLKLGYEDLDATYFINNITKDHDNDDAEPEDQICNPVTRQSYIIQSNPDEDKWVYWSRGRPCENEEFVQRSFDDIFNPENPNGITISSHDLCPNGYYYQSGSIPYLIEELANYDYLLDDYTNDTNYTLNVTMFASISDLLTGDKKQSNHDYTISRTNEIDITNDTFFVTLVADGIVNASLNNDDPANKTWNTIQKAADNMTNLDILIVENGTYNEDVVLNKSIIIFGEDEETTIINGSIIMNNPHDYELLQETDQIANVNMTGVSLLMHFNNHLKIGENYSNSTNIYDYSPLNNNGTNNNASFTTSTIKGEGAFVFNGINNSINLSSIPALVGGNVTVSSWIYWKEGTGYTDTIISQSNDTLGYCLFVNSTTNIPNFRLDTTTVVSSSSISEGWHNIVGTHNQTTLKIYIDGVPTGSASKSGSGANRYAFIGFDNISSYFNGTIDEIAVWNRTLSSTEISHIYEQHYGVVIDGFTIKNGNIGIKPVNHTDITNCIIQNYTTGILVENVSDIKIQCNFTGCTTSLKISNNNPDEFNKIRVMDSYFDGTNDGIMIDNTTNIDIYRTSLKNFNTPLEIINSNFSKINIYNLFSAGNYSPDTPDITGPALGDIDTSYSYNYCTNDSNGDCIFYYFDWGDGNNTGWFGPNDTGVSNHRSHIWTEQGGYYVKLKAKDIFYNETSWSIPILFRTETLSPLINSVNDTPDTIGFGYNVTITANVTDNTTGNYSGIKSVRVDITYPDSSTVNRSMLDKGNDTYEYVFTDSWCVGQYNYTIWATDNAYNTAVSSGHSFNISVDATISICTINSSYGSNETVNLTDPPSSSYLIGYELLNDGDVLHIWNKYDSYYFNTSSGIQLTNHYDEYWSHNVLMLGYYNNNEWNLIYRTDELSGFNKNIESDGETYVNVTLWKDLTYQGYDFRLAIRYYLGVDDNELTVIPYIKNIDQNDIPYILGFGWEMKDIQIDMTASGDYINVNRTMYYLNQTLNNTYTDLLEPEFYLMENITSSNTKSLYLKWNQSLTYKLCVKSREGQYNAPVTLFIRIGTLDVGQEKYTELFWYDAEQVIYYFDSYDNNEVWASNPGYMIDGSLSNYASTTVDGDVELCDGNNCSGSDLGTISAVELRVYSYYSSGQRDTILRPVFGGTTDGMDCRYQTPLGIGAWSGWFDITNDPFAPQSWGWSDIVNLDCDVEAENDPWGPPTFTLYCSKIEVRVTYTPYNYAPVISNPVPVDSATGVGIQPVLNITVSDTDGDNMNITWLSNSSGSWQTFGSNSSVGNGTYHQTMSNASVNGQWWFWKVNVSDGTNYTVSDVFSFYTGYQSKINNSGSTDIKGYLLIQVQFWNTTLEQWVLANDTINETTTRVINSSEQFGLDTLFNGKVNTSYLNTIFGAGTYRVYAAFRDPDGDVLVCDDQSLMEDSYQFTVSAS